MGLAVQIQLQFHNLLLQGGGGTTEFLMKYLTNCRSVTFKLRVILINEGLGLSCKNLELERDIYTIPYSMLFYFGLEFIPLNSYVTTESEGGCSSKKQENYCMRRRLITRGKLVLQETEMMEKKYTTTCMFATNVEADIAGLWVQR